MKETVRKIRLCEGHRPRVMCMDVRTLVAGCVLWAASLAVGVSGEESYQYVGCFRDVADDRDLMEKEITFTDLSIEDCASECRKDGWAYAGLQNKQKCFCGPWFNNHGKAPFGSCNYTCPNTPECGGVLTNSVYYAVKIDSASKLQREDVVQTEATIFENARRTCIQNEGEMAIPNTPDLINATIDLAVQKGVEGDKIWFGLQRPPTGWYVWTDSSATKLDRNAFNDFWYSIEERWQNPCVVLHLSTGKWESTNCHAHYPYVCTQIPPADGDLDTDLLDTEDEEKEEGPSNLALYIVLPIFIFCYGGSCLVYCIGKLYRNCKKKKKMLLEKEETFTEFEPENKPPGPPPPAVVPVKPPPPKNKTVPAYIPEERPIRTPVQDFAEELPTVASAVPVPAPAPPKRGYTPGSASSSTVTSPPDTRPATSQGVTLSLGTTPRTKTPADKQEKRRVKLLENALKEARDRKRGRESKMESRPETRADTTDSFYSRPGSASTTIINENDSLPIPPKHKKKRKKRDSPDSGDSMTDLLGEGDGKGEDDKPQHMSIQDIMKVKMLMKSNVSKPRKIIAV